MKQKNRTAFLFRIFAAGIVLTLFLVGTIVAMQSSEAGQASAADQTRITETATTRVSIGTDHARST